MTGAHLPRPRPSHHPVFRCTCQNQLIRPCQVNDSGTAKPVTVSHPPPCTRHSQCPGWTLPYHVIALARRRPPSQVGTQEVLEDDDLLDCILSKVDTCSAGWSFMQWAAASSVCKQWRHQMLRQPVQLHLVQDPDAEEQADGLLNCLAPVRTLSCHKHTRAAIALVQNPAFQKRNSHRATPGPA